MYSGTILSTALPAIASSFNAYSSQGFVSSSFLLTESATILWWGQALKIHVAKSCMLAAIAIFELGSIICALLYFSGKRSRLGTGGAAPNIDALIAGRAIAGVGAAGISEWPPLPDLCIAADAFTVASLIVLMAQITSLDMRPKVRLLFAREKRTLKIRSSSAGLALSSVSRVSSVRLLAVLSFVWLSAQVTGLMSEQVDHTTWRWCISLLLADGPHSLVQVLFHKLGARFARSACHHRHPQSCTSSRFRWQGPISSSAHAAITPHGLHRQRSVPRGNGCVRLPSPIMTS